LHSGATSPINSLLQTKLREHALTLRALSVSLRADATLSSEQVHLTLRAKKEQLMQEIYTIMSATLGVPPRPDVPFVWEYYNEDKKYCKWEGTPIEFYRAFTTKYSVGRFSLSLRDVEFITLI
jgi:bleomycin hydrolase